MTIANETALVRYVGNGVTTEFPFEFLIPEGALLVQVFNGSTISDLDSSAYSVSGLGNANGGTVTLNDPLADGHEIYISRVLAYVQETSIANQQRFYASVVENAFDYFVMLAQQLNEKVGRAILARPGVDAQAFVDELFAAGVDAETAKDAAEASATAADESATKAEEWAEKAEDAPVETGPDKFSAKHWAAKAEGFGSDKQPLNANLTSLSGLTLAADKMLYATAADTLALADLTAAGRALLDDADAAAQRTTLGAVGADGGALLGGYWIASATADDGTKSSGTYTPDPADGNIRRIVNGGAFTLAAPTAAGFYTMIVRITNNATAGAVTFSGFDLVDGDDLTTTDTHVFNVFITKLGNDIDAHVRALQ
jgi:hypothetical protein